MTKLPLAIFLHGAKSTCLCLFVYINFVTDKASVRSDAAAELDRLTRAQKKGGGTQGGSTANSIDVINNSSEC